MTAIPPSLATVKAYLGTSHSWSDAEITAALAAETVAQATRVRLPADLPGLLPTDPTIPQPYPLDLSEALCRRVHHNLALRALPLSIQTTITDVGASAVRLNGTDPEVIRLERPYRRMAVG